MCFIPFFLHILPLSSMAALPPARQFGEDVRKPPRYAGRVALAFWRLQLWFECTFGLTVMEPWERMVVRAFCFLFAWSGPAPKFCFQSPFSRSFRYLYALVSYDSSHRSSSVYNEGRCIICGVIQRKFRPFTCICRDRILNIYLCVVSLRLCALIY